MKNITKNWKTSLVALIGIANLALFTGLLLAKEIDVTGYAVGVGTISSSLGVLTSLFAKDGDKTGV